MLTKNIDEMKAEIAKHIKADAVIQGSYWDEADVLSEKYGIPIVLIILLEGIFKALNHKNAVKFFKDIGDAISVDNKDLTLVYYSFIRDTLKRLPVITETTQDVINGLTLLSEGKNWPEQEAVYDAAYTAAEAGLRDADAAASAAASADVWAAYWVSARAARAAENYEKERKLQAVEILELLKDAPIMENNNAN